MRLACREDGVLRWCGIFGIEVVELSISVSIGEG